MTSHIRGFFSYSREDDEAEFGSLTRLRASIQRELAMRLGLSGRNVEVFQDTEELRTGNDWERRLREAVMQSQFFILVSTPRSFRSESYTRKELAWFLEREKSLGDNELIMPLAYLPIPGIDGADRADVYAAILKRRQYRRWDHLRHIDEKDRTLRSEIDSLARDIGDALTRCGLVPDIAPAASNTTGASQHATAANAQISNSAVVAVLPAPAIHTVPEIIVDPFGRGDCKTITDAISRATNGERVVVRKGYYYEEVTIDRPIEIVGLGARSEAVIASTRSNVVIFNTNFGRISGLTLHNRAPQSFCIDILQGRLQLEDCELSSDGFSVVSVRQGADPVISQCRIHDGRQCGILIYDKGRGTYEDNDICGNAYSGIEVRTEGDPVFRRNRIFDGKARGVYVHSEGRGKFEDNDIYGNTAAGKGIRLADDVTPTLKDNKLLENPGDEVEDP